MGNRQTKIAKPQTEVPRSAPKLETASEPSTVKTEVPVAIPETPPQPSEPSFSPSPDDTSPTKDPTPASPLEEAPVETSEIKERKESEKELLEPLPVLLNESESVEEKLKKCEEEAQVMESVTEQNETVLVTAPITDQEVIFEDPIPITSEPQPTETKELIKETEVEIIEECKIEDVSQDASEMTKETTSETNLDTSPEAVVLDTSIAVCKVQEQIVEETKEQEHDNEEEEEEIADSKTPSIAMETASVSSSAIKMDEEYMKGIMGTSLAFPDATSNESVIGSLAVSEQTLDESLWDNSGPSKSSIKCPPPPPPPCEEDSLIYVGFEVFDGAVGVFLTTHEPIEKADQKKHEMIPKEAPEGEIPESNEVQSKSVLESLDEEIPAPEMTHSSSELSKLESFVSIEFHEENNEIKVGMNCVSKIQIASSNSMISDKQMSVELKTPFENVEADGNLKESKSGDALPTSISSEKSKTKKSKKSTGSEVEGDFESTNVQVKKSKSAQKKLPKSSSSSSARGRGSRGRGRGRKN